jgi:aspartyl-tRNA(Asn)/glutamyl-tRNA(Gln) amidotransferase subunit A
MNGVTELSARTLAGHLADGDISAAEVCETFLDRIRELDLSLHAFQTVDAGRTLARARALDDERRRNGPCGPLHGVPVAVKDNLCTRGLTTTAASRILEGFVPPYDACVIERLEAAGAIVIGKANLDEFAMGSSTENSAFGPSRNPWDTNRTPGGSSGGSTVAVAARMAPLALGSDTGGSVRQPAALCGVVGLKPTYGRVSRYGLIAFASSLDQIGPIARSAEDAALLLQAIAGHDPRDSTSSSERVPDFVAALTGTVHGLRIGVPRAFIAQGVASAVTARFEDALEVFRAHGAIVSDVDMPHARYAIPVYYLVATAEASANLARYDGVRYGFRASLEGDEGLQAMYDRTRDQGFGAEVKRRIMLGTYVLSAGYYDAFYLKAQQVRTRIREDYERAFERVDVVAMPTTPTPAFRLGEKTADPIEMYLADIFTVSAPLAGLPAISVPCGFSEDNLPIGLQLTGRMFDEGTLLATADAYQRHTRWHVAEPTGVT